MEILIVENYNVTMGTHGPVLRSLLQRIEGLQDINISLFDGTPSEHQPDLVVKIVDAKRMPVGRYADEITPLRLAYPESSIIVYGHMPLSGIRRYLRKGMKGYLSLEAGPDEMLDCFSTVFGGAKYLENHILYRLIVSEGGPYEARLRPSLLTPIEKQVGELLIKGEQVNTIAAELNRRPQTISHIKHKIYRKLNAPSVSILIQRWGQLGI